MDGFYKLDGTLLYAPNFVLNANYELRKGGDYSYPVDGWYWFNTREEALAFFNIKEEVVNE